MTLSRRSDVSRIEMLLEHITGNPLLAFYFRRIGKTLAGKTKPLLVQFSSESDSRHVLHHAHYLKNMQSQWTRIVIAPDRTKQQQDACRRLRLELQTRRSNGECLIISVTTSFQTSVNTRLTHLHQQILHHRQHASRLLRRSVLHFRRLLPRIHALTTRALARQTDTQGNSKHDCFICFIKLYLFQRSQSMQ